MNGSRVCYINLYQAIALTLSSFHKIQCAVCPGHLDYILKQFRKLEFRLLAPFHLSIHCLSPVLRDVEQGDYASSVKHMILIQTLSVAISTNVLAGSFRSAHLSSRSFKNSLG